MLIAAFSKKSSKRDVNDIFRAGFAAGPIPIYILLPLAPFDPDLMNVLLDQPVQLFIAAVVGLVWTFADIARIVGWARKSNGLDSPG